MGRRIIRLRPWSMGIFAIEGLMVGVLAGMASHSAGMHGALVATIGMAAFALFIVLISKVAAFYWLWTAVLIVALCRSVYLGIPDKGWAIFWMAVTAAVVYWLHRQSRAGLHGRLIEDEYVVRDQ